MSKKTVTGSKTSAALVRATGRDYDEWFAWLDTWGASGRPFREIAGWLTGTHGLSRWWAQKLIVEYEQERGLRQPGVRRDGTFEVGASKTVAVPVARLYDAFVNSRQRKKWLDKSMTLRTSEPGRGARFEWKDGASRVVVEFNDMKKDKSQVMVQHQRLPNARTAKETKAYWRERLVVLKAMLEK